MAEDKFDWLEVHQEQMKVLGFWSETYRSSIIKQVERAYMPHIIREYGISDIVMNGDKVLLKWFKRHLPLSNEELKEEYGFSIKTPKKRSKRK